MNTTALTEHYAETGLGIQQLSIYLLQREGHNVCAFVESGRSLLVSVREMYTSAARLLAFIDEPGSRDELQMALERIDSMLEAFSDGLFEPSILSD